MPYIPLVSELVAFVEIAMAIVLVLGMFLVRRGRVRLHMYLQSSVILVNVPLVLAWMVPQYLAYVLPDLPSEGLALFYLLPTIALVVGGVAEGLGIFILLVAATTWVPERYRFRNYKRWMRTELVLWWGVVVLGLGIYVDWYLIPGAGGS